REIEERDEWPRDLEMLIRKPPHSLHGPVIPQAYGGRGLSLLDTAIIMEEIAAVNFSMATVVEMGTLTALCFLNAGSEEQKRRYLTRMAAGEAYCGFMLTDDQGGSDPAGMSTTAERRGDGYVLNGLKRLVSVGEHADLFVVFAKTRPGERRRAISLFVVERDTPGLTMERRQVCFGMKGHQTWDMRFRDCFVPADQRLGEEGRGLGYALKALDDSRATLACGYLGVARSALAIAVEYAKGRETFGKRLILNQGIAFPLMEYLTQIEAARLLAYQACEMGDRGLYHKKETAMAKWMASEVAIQACQFAIRVLGGNGASTDYPLEQYLRDVVTFALAQGSPEVQRITACQELFGVAPV
ncbi:MAG: acyl-CoA dehydrogenase family protein, partial [Clostridia bacterium]|nr:acyl-CoA dehydrogenase family protein [Clostridia bacterium]